MEDKYSVEESKSIRTGLMALLVILIAVFVTVSHNASVKRKKLSGGYNIYANFGRTDGLGVGDNVRMSGITIGRVISAELDQNFSSKLTLEIDSKYKIPEDSSASIVSFGLIGGKYVDIEVGGSEDYLKSGDSIGYTQDSMIIEELLDRIISMGKAKRKQAQSIEENIEKKSNVKEAVEEISENIENQEETTSEEIVKGDENE